MKNLKDLKGVTELNSKQLKKIIGGNESDQITDSESKNKDGVIVPPRGN